MKLLFVFTGGTIGSTRNGDVISTEGGKSYKIIDAYKKQFGIDFEFDTVEPYTELSENNTGWHIKRLVNCVKENADKGYDGIIVTHGTDTLQYSAAAIGYCMGLDSVPICLVSANYPIEDARSNAMDNLHGAICLISRGDAKGVFVVYRNEDSDIVCVHRATRLIGPKAYSDEASSVRNIVYGTFAENFSFRINERYVECNDECEVLDASLLEEGSSEIMVINSYPAMIYPQISSGVKCVIINSYHSGTINTKSQKTIDFMSAAREKGVKVYVTGVSEGPQYASAEEFAKLGIIPIKNLSPIAAYVKIWLLLSAKNNIEKMLQASICGDRVIFD